MGCDLTLSDQFVFARVSGAAEMTLGEGQRETDSRCNEIVLGGSSL